MTTICKMTSIILVIAIICFSMTGLSDNTGDSSEPTMTLTVDAGPNQTVNEGDTVQLSGTASAVTTTSYPLWPVDISEDGRFLAVGWDKNVTFFSTSSNVPLWTFNTATDGKVGDLKLSDDGRYLTVGSYRSIFYFDTTSSNPIWSVTLGDSILRYDGDPGNRMDMTYDGRFVAASATGQRMVMFDATSATPTTPYWDHAYGDHVECVRFSGDGKYLSMGSFNGKLKLASVFGRSILWTANPGDRVYSTSIPHNGGLISIGQGNSHRVSLYSSGSSSPLWTSTLEGRQFEQDLSYDGGYLASGNHYDGFTGTWSGFAFWDTSNSNPIWTYWTGATISTSNADAVDMDDDANFVVGGSRDNNVYLFSQYADGSPGWSSLDGVPTFIYTTGGTIHYNGVSISSDGTYFAAGSFEGVVYLFSTVGTPHLLWTWNTTMAVPFSDTLRYNWDIDGTTDSDGDGDPANDIDLAGEDVSHIYGDDGVFTVTLTVTDGQGNTAQDTCEITVLNVAPSVTIESAIMDVEVGLRVAGRKYNDVAMTLYLEGSPLGYVSIERVPGSPDAQMAWIPVSLDMTKNYSATVTYIPEDPPDIGSNPVWIYIRFENGSIEKLHHNFNVQQSMKRDSGHWNHVEPWDVDLNTALLGHEFGLICHITDPGSDDEMVTCDYASQNIIKTYLNNPPDPDPYPSPDVNPVDIITAIHVSYEGPGILFLQVVDDDGGVDVTDLALQ